MNKRILNLLIAVPLTFSTFSVNAMSEADRSSERICAGGFATADEMDWARNYCSLESLNAARATIAVKKDAIRKDIEQIKERTAEFAKQGLLTEDQKTLSNIVIAADLTSITALTIAGHKFSKIANRQTQIQSNMRTNRYVRVGLGDTDGKNTVTEVAKPSQGETMARNKAFANRAGTYASLALMVAALVQMNNQTDNLEKSIPFEMNLIEAEQAEKGLAKTFAALSGVDATISHMISLKQK